MKKDTHSVVDFGDAVKYVLLSLGQWLAPRCDKWFSVFVMPILTAAGSLCSRFPTSSVPCFIECVYVFSMAFRTTSSDKDQWK